MCSKHTLLERQQAMRERFHETRTKASGVPAVRQEMDSEKNHNLHLPIVQKSKVERAKAISLKLEGKPYSEIGKLIGKSRQYAQSLCRPQLKVRVKVRARANDCCEDCLEPQFGCGHFHHVKTEGKTVDTYSDSDNIEYLCGACHIHKHGDPTTVRIVVSTDPIEIAKLNRRAAAYRMTVDQYIHMKLNVRLKLGLDKDEKRKTS